MELDNVKTSKDSAQKRHAELLRAKHAAQIQRAQRPSRRESEMEVDEAGMEKPMGDVKPWAEMTQKEKVKTVLWTIARFVFVIILLYFFICSLNLLSKGFILIGGRAARSLSHPLLRNPVCGLLIGVVVTAFLQSSSTTTSIIVSMVAAGLITVRVAIPMVMGANIGTSVTGIIVSVGQATERQAFRRAFSAATVHDMFNWLTVLILLPIETIFHYLEVLTNAMVNGLSAGSGGTKVQFLQALTNPFIFLIVQIDRKTLDMIARRDDRAKDHSLLKIYCKKIHCHDINTTWSPPIATKAPIELSTFAMTNSTPFPTVCDIKEECRYLFHPSVTCCLSNFTEVARGVCVLLIALFMLITCLILMVKVLKSLLAGSMAGVIQKSINANFPGKFACFTGYVFILIGAILTVFVQSSSVVCSTLTPLVGLNFITIERIYPMMLGANIGTTSTAILAAFAASADRFRYSLQIALCHLFFNLSGIVIWYPIPLFRALPIRLARFLGRTTSKYRWFAAVYIIGMFFLLPLAVFGLSIPGWPLLLAVLILVFLIAAFVIILNQLQNRRRHKLPAKLQTWEFLPKPLRSLEPYDRVFQRCACCKKCAKDFNDTDVEANTMATTENNNSTAKARAPATIIEEVSTDGSSASNQQPMTNSSKSVIMNPGGGTVTSVVTNGTQL